MLSTVPAADIGAPSITSAPGHSLPRRAFLASLARLPLIGGSVALLGQPSAVAQPATRQILEAYKTWLHYEHRALSWEMADLPEMIAYYGGTKIGRYDILEPMTINFGTGDASNYHRFDGSSPASSRAALVLSTVGCNWHDDEAPSDWLIPVRRV